MCDAIGLHARSLAKDGARRAEIRAICEEGVIDKIMSWREWLTLEAIAEEASTLGRPS